jgi:putrescine aminotransferase
MTVREQIASTLSMPPTEVRRLHAEHINPVFMEAIDLFGFGRTFVRAEGLSLWDAEGREHTDFLSGYGALALGHNHPDVHAAVDEVLRTPTPHFLLVSPHPLAAELARRLTSLAPSGLDRCFLGSSGSEAVEGALKLARAATSRPRLLAADGSYHGTTLGALSVTGNRKHRTPFEPLLGGCQFVPFGDVDAVERELRRRDVAGLILEPVQGEGGVRVPPPGYLAEVAKLCRKYGTLLILDEVQTGLGRCGHLFACAADSVEPDVLLLAKGLSGGLAPISALLTRRALWDRAYGTFERQDLHCSTYSGGPVACAAALATLAVIERDALCVKANELGAYLGERLRAVTAGHRLIREVRGLGLFWGLELRTPFAGVPADLVGQWLVVGLLERGQLTQTCGDAPSVVRVQPPLTVTRTAIDGFVDALSRTLTEHATGVVSSMAGALGRAALHTLRSRLRGRDDQAAAARP